jgi:hypothetical protein
MYRATEEQAVRKAVTIAQAPGFANFVPDASQRTDCTLDRLFRTRLLWLQIVRY